MKESSSQLLRPRQVCKLIGDIHISTLYRWMDEGKFNVPKHQLGPRLTLFRKSDVDKWIDRKLGDKNPTNTTEAV